MPPEVNCRRRAEGVELRRFRRQRRGEHHRDEQTDRTVRQFAQDERDEDVVGVFRLGARIGRQQRSFGFGANLCAPTVGLEHGRAGARLRGGVLGSTGVQPGANRLLHVRDRDGMSLFEGEERARFRTSRVTLPLGLVEKQWGTFELVEHEQERAEQENKKLHRNFQERIEHQTEPTFAQRTAADVALHLRLIGSEIREREKQSAQKAGPECVAPARVERDIHRLQLPHGTGYVRRTIEPEPLGQLHHQHHQSGYHPREDHRHLPLLRQADRLVAARDGVYDNEQPGEHDDEIQPPAERRGENDGGRVDRHSGGEATL